MMSQLKVYILYTNSHLDYSLLVISFHQDSREFMKDTTKVQHTYKSSSTKKTPKKNTALSVSKKKGTAGIKITSDF